MADLTLEEVCSKLWDLDENRLISGQDYKLNLQGDTKEYSRKDMTTEKLFTFLKEDVFKRKTYKSFFDLLEHYQHSTAVDEVVAKQEVGKDDASS